MHRPEKYRIVWFILLFLSGIVALLNLSVLLLQIPSPNDTTVPESQTVYTAQRFAWEEPLYPNFHEFDYNIAPYTPGFYVLLGFLSRSFGLSTTGIFHMGRGLSFLFCIAMAVMLFFHSRKVSGARAAWLTAFLLCGSYVLWSWAATSRPDMMAVFLSAAGFVLYCRSNDPAAKRLSGVLFLLAFFTKQTALSAPAAVFLHCLLQGRKKEAATFALSLAAPALLLLLLLHVTSDGLSSMNIVYGNSAPMQWLNMRLILNQFLQFAALPLILAVAGASMRGARDPKTIYLVTSLAWGIVTSSKLGSNINYFIEPLVACCLLIPAGAGALIAALRSKLRIMVPALFLVLLLPPANFLFNTLQKIDLSEQTEVKQLVRQAQGYTLTDNSRLAFYGRQSFLIDPFQLSFLEMMGKWNSTGVQAMLERHEIQYVILTLPLERTLAWQGVKRIPASLIPVIQKHYRFLRIVDGYYVYVPV